MASMAGEVVVVLDECDVPSTSARCGHNIERNDRARGPGLVGPSSSGINEEERRRKNKGKRILKVSFFRKRKRIENILGFCASMFETNSPLLDRWSTFAAKK